MNSIDKLHRIAGLLSQAGCEITLAPGASEADITSAERQLGFPFPSSLRALYRHWNGECGPIESGRFGLFCNYEFLSLAKVVHVWNGWEETRQFLARSIHTEPWTFKSRPPHAVKTVYSDPAWIPLAGAGNCSLAVDFDPGPDGITGQITNFGRDDQVHFQIARDFDKFLDVVERRYRNGEWHSAFGPSTLDIYDSLVRGHRLD